MFGMQPLARLEVFEELLERAAAHLDRQAADA
jgi:hypothetical protein